MTGLRLEQEHVRRFAAGSGDTNPLHLDPVFARRTPYGQCIAHGALVALVALAAAEERALRQVDVLSMRFPRPVYPGEYVDVRVGPRAGDRTAVEAWTSGQCSARVTIDTAVAAASPQVPNRPPTFRTTACRTAPGDLTTAPGTARRDGYAPDIRTLRALAEDLRAGHVPDAMLAWLAAASYTVGMLVPGRDALFAAARVEPVAADPASAYLEVRAEPPHPATGLVEVAARFGYGPASARLRLHAFAREPVSGPRQEVLAAHLPPSDALHGRHVLVVGASRGLGAAIAAALAMQGATVWAAYARSTDSAEDLRTAFGADTIRPVQFDATDAAATRDALVRIGEAAGVLDGVVLCAAPPLHDLALHRDAVPAALGYVQQAFAMVLNPLVEVLPRMAAHGGWLAFVSSAAVADPPATWPHYVAAKGALEALAAHCRKHSGLRVVTVRPPRMRTDMTNGPTGRVGAAATELVGAQLVSWVLDRSRQEDVLGPTFAAAVRP